jgi:hypothetical protein
MSEIKPLSGSDLQIKPALIATRKIGGRIVRTELELPVMEDAEGLDTLLDGVSPSEVEEGRDKLMHENPHQASMQIHEMLEIDEGAEELAREMSSQKRIASTKRLGRLADKATGDAINFRRTSGNQVELTDDSGQILHTLSSADFDKVLDTNSFTVL